MNQFRWKLAQFFEKWWWRHYLRNQDDQTYLQYKINYWHFFLRKLDLPAPQNKFILDAGCGPAGIFCALDQSNKIIGVDPLIERYQDSFQTLMAGNSHVQFVKDGLENYKSNQAFDFIFCLNAINHVYDMEGSLQQLIRNSKPDTVFVLSSDVHRSSIFASFMKIFSWLDVLHPYQMTKEEFEQLFEKNGMKLKKSVELKKGIIFNYQTWLLQV